ncbi:MAG: hypothetical protein HOV79_26870, partial [Hamadaea sp.]|nr:hypothetical protein [Hamadaea sp.]
MHRRQAPQRRDRRGTGPEVAGAAGRGERAAPGSGARVKVVAFGGGTGLSASLRALRASGVPSRITAIVTVGDNGGSSGRLRLERGALPPGDLRQALAALAGDDPVSSRS